MGERAVKEVTPQEERDRILREVVKQWNGLVSSILKAAKSWKAYCELKI